MTSKNRLTNTRTGPTGLAHALGGRRELVSLLFWRKIGVLADRRQTAAFLANSNQFSLILSVDESGGFFCETSFILVFPIVFIAKSFSLLEMSNSTMPSDQPGVSSTDKDVSEVTAVKKSKPIPSRYPLASMALGGIKSPSDVLSPCSRKLWGRKKFERVIPKLSLEDHSNN